MNKVTVATDVCADFPPLIDINLDCSLCTIGWPMRKGIIRIKFYGPPCKRWWCVKTGSVYSCVEAMTPPAGAVGGPYLNEPDCLLACASSGNPYWCSNYRCVQSATPPSVCDAGPYASFSDCLAACSQASTPRNESFWLFGFGASFGNFKCFQPGEDFEPDPTAWGADYISSKYRVQAVLNVVNTTTINVVVNVFANSPRSIWVPYTTFSATMTENSCTSTNPLPYRLRWFKSDYLPVTVSEAGGLGDPIQGADIHVELYGMQLGCGWPHSFTDDVGPICGMWDGSGWHTCFRAHMEVPAIGTEKAQPGVLVEMGLRKEPTGSMGGAISFAECDQIYRDPPITGAWKTRWNTGTYESLFKSQYQYIGFNGESSNDTQQIQLGMSGAYNLCVKKIGTRAMQMGIQDPSTNAWEIVDLTTVQPSSPSDVSHPWIHVAVFPIIGITVYLYSMRFPSAEILPGECCAVQFPESGHCDSPSGYSGIDPEIRPMQSIVPQQLADQFKTQMSFPESTSQQEAKDRILKRIRIPCINLGDFIESRKLSCGCGTFSVFKCEKYGECVKIAPSNYTELKHCDNCESYQGSE